MTSTLLFSAVIPPLDGEFLYAFDPAKGSLVVGHRLELPFGRRMATGFVISVATAREEQAAQAMAKNNVAIRSIDPSGASHAFSPEQLPFFSWIAAYYVEPLSKILDLALPVEAHSRKDPSWDLTEKIPPDSLGVAQKKVLLHLQEQGGSSCSSAIREACGTTSATLRSLEAKGLILRCDHEVSGGQATPSTSSISEEVLNHDQAAASATISKCVRATRFASFLLHGITGSGKTEVYISIIREALAQGKGALIVVPEIALTPQLVQRFRDRLTTSLAVLHSSLPPAERWRNWRALLDQKATIAIGPRSAIFAPVHNVGVIIVDEEHDSSFKQAEGIRYNARDLALVRGKLSSCPVVLGSATPSLETFHHALSGRHTLLKLGKRYYDAPGSTYTIVDLNKIKPWLMPSKSISPLLLEQLQISIEKSEQAFLLYNRRGFASYLQCTECEMVLKCPHCTVTLTYHQKPHSLLCHFCGFSCTPMIVCPGCGRTETQLNDAAHSIEPIFAERGSGTERVFDELRSLIPKARIGKLDRDSVHTVQDYVRILDSVRNGDIDILVGTQMIAKGHDLPNVTLVGIVDCDVGLHMPDFRAAERGFQLLSQVSGRAGRREKQGRVILQTRIPSHSSITMTVQEDFDNFAQNELDIRRELTYPPFSRLLRLIIASEDRSAAQEYSASLVGLARQLAVKDEITVLGPVAASIEKVRRHWRFHSLCKSASSGKLQNFLASLRTNLSIPRNIRVVFDLDPQDML